MTQEEREQIVSNDYADIIVNYLNNPQILNRIPNAVIHIMNEVYAVVHFPVSQLTAQRLGTFGFYTVPSLNGLASEVAIEASEVSRLRNIPGFDLRGEGVLVGIVDTGIDYTLPVFKKEDNTTRIVALWDQTIQTGSAPFNTDFGTEYTMDVINQALQSPNPFEVVPSTDENGHGTALAGVAAGNEVERENFTGVATRAELVVVKLKQAKSYLREFFVIPPEAVCYQENSIMWGVQYCVQVARKLNRPIVICLGIGTSQDAHDGRSPLSTLLSLLGDYPKTAIVTALGNEGNKGRHYRGTINPAIGKIAVELNVGEGEGGFAMELWGDAPGIFSVDFLSPSGEYIPRIPPGIRVSREIAFIFDQTIINVDYRAVETVTGDQLILMRFRNVSPGIWRINVYGQGDLPSIFHIWLPMGDFISNETYFIQPDIYTTLIAPGTAEVPMTVTSYNAVNGILYVNASRGYTRANVIKPEFAAPGVNYIAPTLGGGYANFSGTGVAAAHAAGVTALMLEWGVVLGNQPNMNTIEIKKFFIRGAKRNVNLLYPNRDWGYGILDIYGTFNVLRTNL